jgi:hypothetical protein
VDADVLEGQAEVRDIGGDLLWPEDGACDEVARIEELEVGGEGRRRKGDMRG